MLQASFVTCETQCSGGIEWLSSLEVKPGKEEEVWWGEGGDGGQWARQAVQIYCVMDGVEAPTAISAGSCSSLQCHGNSGAGWPDLRMWWI